MKPPPKPYGYVIQYPDGGFLRARFFKLDERVENLVDADRFDDELSACEKLKSAVTRAQIDEKIGDAVNCLILLEALFLEEPEN